MGRMSRLKATGSAARRGEPASSATRAATQWTVATDRILIGNGSGHGGTAGTGMVADRPRGGRVGRAQRGPPAEAYPLPVGLAALGPPYGQPITAPAAVPPAGGWPAPAARPPPGPGRPGR